MDLQARAVWVARTSSPASLSASTPAFPLGSGAGPVPHTTIPDPVTPPIPNVHCRSETTHNVIFGPAFKDRILLKFLKGRRRGMQFPYWVEVYSSGFFPQVKPDHTANPNSRYLKIAKLVRSPSFEMAPKRPFTERAWPQQESPKP